MSDDYSKHPESVAEIRARRSDKSADWTPRDALIEALRLWDSGERRPEALVLVGLLRNPDGTAQTYVTSASADAITTTGLLATGMSLRATR